MPVMLAAWVREARAAACNGASWASSARRCRTRTLTRMMSASSSRAASPSAGKRTACHKLLVGTWTFGAEGGVGLPAVPGDAELVGVALILAAASRAEAASAVPNPEPSVRPSCGAHGAAGQGLLDLSRGERGELQPDRAAMPATTALAALVLFIFAYAVGPLAATTPLPAAVSVA